MQHSGRMSPFRRPIRTGERRFWRLLPHVLLRTSHRGDITRAEHSIVQADPTGQRRTTASRASE